MDGYTTGPNGMRETEADRETRDQAYRVSADELRQFIERWERLEQERKELAGDQKEIMAEAKGRGYCVKTMRRVMSERRKEPDLRAEEQAVFDLYAEALGLL